MDQFKSISSNTYIDSCEGMCKRVLKDIEDNFSDEEILLDAYITDINNGGRDYTSIMQLGLLLKELDVKYKGLKYIYERKNKSLFR
ncbi:hypothetical protein JOC70_000726 [Clostridium pascui]|uniref:hypothetical protein n=1 Tax=Clostridium pascui TaxID=46609 RepID=UPI0019564441|nr:hypothetical protein [Clostridium pascui]MBM7869257.1 hypothetical protein [Clostridium pascui]